jgi:hypothetical protein
LQVGAELDFSNLLVCAFQGEGPGELVPPDMTSPGMKHFLKMFFFGTESRDPGFDSASFPNPDPEPFPAGGVFVQDFHVRTQHDEAER